MITFIWPYYDKQARFDELRFSIRSVEMFFKGEANCLVVGDKPAWWDGSFVPVERSGVARDFRSNLRDALTKFHRGLSVASSEEVVWMMDDTFFTKSFDLDALRVPRANGLCPSFEGSTGFLQAKARTRDVLKERGLPTWDFATHIPHCVDRKLALDLFQEFDVIGKGLLWEILYRNLHLKCRPAKTRPFFRYVEKAKAAEEISDIASRHSCFNTGASAWTADTRRWAFQNLNQRSAYEVGHCPAPRNLNSEARFTPWGQGWTAPNRTSPEFEFMGFVKSLIALHRPGSIIETGMGKGFVTRAVHQSMPVGSDLLVFESDPKYRSKPPICNCKVSGNPSPSEEEMAAADLVLLDSLPAIRMKEISLWWKVGKPGSTMVVHDVSDRHPPGAIHSKLLRHIRSEGIPGALLRNPRGGYVATKDFI